MASLYGEARRLQLGDVLRAAAYTALGNWALMYAIFPPPSFVALATYTRVIWLGITVFGAVLATIGSLTRLDYKVELPGLMFMSVGPLFYTLINLWFFFLPTELSGASMTRFGTAFMTLSLFLLLLPRALDLYSDMLKAQTLLARKISEKP